MLINMEPACFSIINGMQNNLVICQKLQSVDLNEYISIQDGIIVIIVFFFIIISTCCCLRMATRGGSSGQGGRG